MDAATKAKISKQHDSTVEAFNRLILRHCIDEKVSTASACLCLISVIGGLAAGMKNSQPERIKDCHALLDSMGRAFPQILAAIRSMQPNPKGKNKTNEC